MRQQPFHPLVVVGVTTVVHETSLTEPEDVSPHPSWHQYEIVSTVNVKLQTLYHWVPRMLKWNHVVNLHQSAKAKANPCSPERMLITHSTDILR
jgi:hypothetical protein